jgi:hypothetical protein
MTLHLKRLVVGAMAVALAACSQSSPVSPTMGGPGGPQAAKPAGKGNGAPSGAHYNLNIIGTNDKSGDMNDSGHVIFVKIQGQTRILLIEGDDYQVIDKNGTDGEASFQLPNPDPDADGTTVYSVFARALGKPSGNADMTTCATDPDGDFVCSVAVLELDASGRPAKFENVSKELLYVYFDWDNDGIIERVPLFADQWEGFLWDYDNRGLRIAQLRFYECSTTVPDDPNDPIVGTSCFAD